jgi:hypothetical protein
MKNILLLSLFCVFLFSCKKNVDELPEPTQTGANTFGAKIDGAFWAPHGFGIVPTAPILEASYVKAGGHVRIVARNFGSSPTEKEMEIYLKDVTGPGTFLLNANTRKHPDQTGNYGYFIERRFMPKNEWITNPQSTGRVELTKFDTVNKIISGTFDFVATNIDSAHQKMQVTEGRFDVKYQ